MLTDTKTTTEDSQSSAPAAVPLSPKTLLITDFDGTVTDLIGPLRKLTEQAHKDIRALYRRYDHKGKMDWDTFLHAIKDEPMNPEYRFHDFERLMRMMKNRNAAFKPFKGDPEFCKAWDKIVTSYQERQRELLRPFAGVFETMRAVKEAGGTVVIWSDAPAMSIFERSWIMHQYLPLLGKPGANNANLIDAIYVPSRGSKYLDLPLVHRQNGGGGAYKNRLQAITHYLPENQFKPSSQHIQTIMREFQKTKEETLMVGDSIAKDGLSAALAGVDFAFFRPGANITEQNADFYKCIQVAHDHQELPGSAKKPDAPPVPYQQVDAWKDILQTYTWPSPQAASAHPQKPPSRPLATPAQARKHTPHKAHQR